jgi:hypothetical protein
MRTLAEADYFGPQSFRALVMPYFQPFWTSLVAGSAAGAGSFLGGPF